MTARRFFVLAWLFVGSLRAIEVTEWKFRQAVTVDHDGLIKFALPPATLDLARPNLEDVRVVDATGREIPFIIQHAGAAVAASIKSPSGFRTTLLDETTQVLITAASPTALDGVLLQSPAPSFLKSARVEISNDGQRWEQIESGVPLFRQFGVEQLRIELNGRVATQVRVTIDDGRSRAVPFTGASLAVAASGPPTATVPVPVRIARREEFAGETVLSIDLGAKNLPLAKLEFVTSESLFARRLSVAVRELRDDAAVERVLSSGSIYRIGVDGLPARSQLRLPVESRVPSRELLVHIQNGDSPLLGVNEVQAFIHPTWILFPASAAGAFTLLTGNADAAAPRYDLATLASSLQESATSSVTVGPPEPNPGFRRPDLLGGTALLGGPVNPAPWSFRKSVSLTAAGVQELELDLDVLARARPGLADLRLVRDNIQIPYLLERPALSRSAPVAVAAISDPKRPNLSRWQIKLPHAGAPVDRLTLNSPTTLFQRHIRVYEFIASDRGNPEFTRTLAESEWSNTPANPSTPLTLPLGSAPQTDTLTIETDNGDNPALMLSAVQASYPVTRLLFKTDFAPLALYYGNREVAAPRYDLALVAAQILSAEKNVAQLGAEEIAKSAGWAAGLAAGARGGILFWAALAAVVIILLVIVARLLPKPPGPSA